MKNKNIFWLKRSFLSTHWILIFSHFKSIRTSLFLKSLIDFGFLYSLSWSDWSWTAMPKELSNFLNYDFLIRAPSRLRLDGYFQWFFTLKWFKIFILYNWARSTHTCKKIQLHLRNVIYFQMTQQKWIKKCFILKWP